jgi:tetratricopeptide (TPR) repeat protein
MRERAQLARAVAEKYGHQLTEVEDWRPLLRYSHGNPMTITAVVGQALRNGLRTREQIEDFVFQLRSGEAEIDDDESEGRSKSLGASLSYGFRNAFTEEEQQQLALLYFFQSFTSVEALRLMGTPEADWCVPTVRGLTWEAGIALLDRAAEVGLLTKIESGLYAIHPASPWYLKDLFNHFYIHLYPTAREKVVAYAFVKAISEMGNYYHRQDSEGNFNVISTLMVQEANLLHAMYLARTNGWWEPLTGTMQGLYSLYNRTGRRAEWARIVEETLPNFINPLTNEPLPGREEQWSLVIQYRILLAKEKRQLEEAKGLQQVCVDQDRQRAIPALAVPLQSLDSSQRNAIQTLAVSLHELGEIQRELGQPECIKAYEESRILSEQVGDKAGVAKCAFNLGNAYYGIPNIRDLDKAEQLYQDSLKLRDDSNYRDRAICFGQLGCLAYKRAENQTGNELLRHLNKAVEFYSKALELLPNDAIDDLAIAHDMLGNIYFYAGNVNFLLHYCKLHYCKAIHYAELAENFYQAARIRYNFAVTLYYANQFDEALLYARAALSNYESFGDKAAAQREDTKQLIELIEQALKAKER